MMAESNSDKPKKNPVPKNFQNKDSVATKNNVVKEKNKSAQESQAVGAVANGAIGSSTRTIVAKTELPAKKKNVEKVAVFSTKNVFWPGVGKIAKGYNIIEKDKLDQWLARDHVREANPEEVAREFGL
jgi:hypothetical protein